MKGVFVQYQGLFWSAIIRALLSQRRDLGISDERDATFLETVNQLEQGQFSEAVLAKLLLTLCPQAHQAQFGRSLIGYFDFNKMSNLVVLLTASKHIDDALHVLGKQYKHILGSQADFSVTANSDTTVLEFVPGQHTIVSEFRCYFLLALFRHLAGRKFDFTTIEIPHLKHSRLLDELSQSKWKTSKGTIKLAFETKWCRQPSFYFSLSIKKMLQATLETNEETPLKQRVKEVFQRTAYPAKIRSEWVARQLGQSESAFRRQLRQGSISFSGMLKEHIHDNSCHLLLSGVKTDDAAEQLGFSDRRSFERSFKEHAGISAGQLRQLGNRLRFQKGNSNLIDVVENLPPLPHSIQTLLDTDEDNITLEYVVSLIEKDPIFQAHVMSKASRAIYGSPPKNLEQAIGRNLGIGNIRHLAVIFAAQQLLSAQCRFGDVSFLTDAMLLSATLFQQVFSFRSLNEDQTEQIKQLLLFGTLSLFLIFHDECLFADGALTVWDEAQTFEDFLQQINDKYGICLYGATSLMLLRWGFQSAVNQQLWKLCQPDDNETGSHSWSEKIKLCHNVAFTASSREQNLEAIQGTTSLTAPQIEILEETISKWNRSVA